jgi:hypothetical protein
MGLVGSMKYPKLLWHKVAVLSHFGTSFLLSPCMNAGLGCGEQSAPAKCFDSSAWGGNGRTTEAKRQRHLALRSKGRKALEFALLIGRRSSNVVCRLSQGSLRVWNDPQDCR